MTTVDHSFGRLCQDAVGETLENLGFKLVVSEKGFGELWLV